MSGTRLATYALALAAALFAPSGLHAQTDQSNTPTAEPTKKGRGFQGIVDDIDKLNREGKGYQSLLDALRVEEPQYFECGTSQSGEATKRRLRMDLRRFNLRSGRTVEVIQIMTRDYDGKGEVLSFSKFQDVYKGKDESPADAANAFASRFPKMLDTLCASQDSSPTLSDDAKRVLREGLMNCKSDFACRRELINRTPNAFGSGVRG